MRQDNIQLVNTWLKTISHSLPSDPILDNEGVSSVQIGEERIIFEVSSHFPVLYIHAQLITLPLGETELLLALLMRALEINGLPDVTHGGAIGAAPGGAFLIYRRLVPLQESALAQISDVLHDVVQLMPQLRKITSGSS